MKLITAGLLFILSIVLIGQNLDKPFYGEHDWNGARYGNIARNYLRYGLINTKFGQVENSGVIDKNRFEYYTHYPPLLPVLISISYKLFGISEWSTRLIPLLANSATVVLIFLIGSHLWDFKTGLLASLLALATPMVLYFGKNPAHEPLVLFFILLSFWGYLKYRKNNQKLFQIIFLIGMILAELTAWAGYFLISAITITLFIKKDTTGIKKLIPYWILAAILFTAHFIHVATLTGSISGGNLFESLLQRSGISQQVQPVGFNLFGYLAKLRLWFATLYTITLSLLAFIWLVLRGSRIRNNDWPVFVLAVLGLIYITLFSNSVFIHNYLIFYFLPFLCLAGSATISYIMRFKILQSVSLVLPILFLTAIFFERKTYLDALNASKADKFAVEIAQALNRQTRATDIVLVSPLKFSYSAEKFLKFYSDRKLIFADNMNLDYDYIVKVDQDHGRYTISKKL